MNPLSESTRWVPGRIPQDKCRPGLIRTAGIKVKPFHAAREEWQIPCAEAAPTDSRLVVIANGYREVFSKRWGETTVNLQFCALPADSRAGVSAVSVLRVCVPHAFTGKKKTMKRYSCARREGREGKFQKLWKASGSTLLASSQGTSHHYFKLVPTC